MSEATRTEGPWRVVPKPRGIFGKDWIEIHGPKRGDWVVMPASFDVQRGDDRWTESGVRIKPEDAALIAAAPDLLAVVEEVAAGRRSDCNERNCTTCTTCRARLALQKAQPEGVRG